MGYEYLRLDRGDDGVAIVTLDWPERLNALGPGSMPEMRAVLRELDEDESVRAVIMTGAGRSFCSGADLNPADPAKHGPMPRRTRTKPMGYFGDLFLDIRNFEKPLIGAINGWAVGGGISLALAMDIRIGSTEAKMNCMQVRRGQMPDAAVTFHLPRIVGTAKALELLWTGEMLDARQALDLGILSRVVEPDQLLPVTHELAARIAQGAPIPVEMTKKAMYAGDPGWEDVLVWESWGHLVALDSDDGREGLNAFKEKREPRFTGR